MESCRWHPESVQKTIIVRASIEPPPEETSKRVSVVFMSQGGRQKRTSAAGGTTVGFQGARFMTSRAFLILLCCAAKPQGNNREVWAGGRVVAGLPQQGPRDREEQGATGKGPPEALWRSLPDHVHLFCCGLLCRVLCSRQCRSVFSSALAMNLQALYGVRPQGAWIYFPTSDVSQRQSILPGKQSCYLHGAPQCM